MFIWVIFLFSTIRLIGLIRHKVTENLVAILTNKVLITADTVLSLKKVDSTVETHDRVSEILHCLIRLLANEFAI